MNSPQPTIRSGLKIPFLDGSNDHLVFSREHWNLIIAAVNSFLASNNWTVTNHGVILDVGSRMGGSGNLQFQQPYVELDPTIAVKQWTIVNVSPANPIATTGLKDLDSLITTNAPTGYWVAIVDIPAQTGTPPKYNVPVMPPSIAWTSSPGSQKGDLDQGSKWWPLPRIGSCV